MINQSWYVFDELYFELLRNGDVRNEIFLVGSVGEYSAQSCGFVQVVDEEFETGHHDFTEGDEFGVVVQSLNGNVGELREEADHSGMSNEMPAKNDDQKKDRFK